MGPRSPAPLGPCCAVTARLRGALPSVPPNPPPTCGFSRPPQVLLGPPQAPARGRIVSFWDPRAVTEHRRLRTGGLRGDVAAGSSRRTTPPHPSGSRLGWRRTLPQPQCVLFWEELATRPWSPSSLVLRTEGRAAHRTRRVVSGSSRREPLCRGGQRCRSRV